MRPILVTKQPVALPTLCAALLLVLVAAIAASRFSARPRPTPFVEPPSMVLPQREEPAVEVRQDRALCNLPSLWGRTWELWVQLDYRAYVIGADGSAEWAEMGMRDRRFRLQRDQLAAVGEMSGASCETPESPSDAAGYLATITVAGKSRTINIPPTSEAGLMLERFAHELEARYVREHRASFGHVVAELRTVGSGAWHPRARYRIRITDESIVITRGRRTVASCTVDPADIVDFVEWTRTKPEDEIFASGTLVAGGVRRTIALASLGADFAVTSIAIEAIDMDDWGSPERNPCRRE